jgi:hypothetical protein
VSEGRSEGEWEQWAHWSHNERPRKLHRSLHQSQRTSSGLPEKSRQSEALMESKVLTLTAKVVLQYWSAMYVHHNINLMYMILQCFSVETVKEIE